MSRFETAIRIEEARRAGAIADADADRLHRANEELERSRDRCDAAGYTLHAPERVGIDFAREGSERTTIAIAARDDLGNRTFRPIIPASRGNLPTREELERELRRGHDLETSLRTVRALVHIRCPNVGVDEVSLVVPSRNEAVRICASCSFAWSESFLEQARDLEAIDLARARVPEIRFVEAIGNLERRESGRFSYGSPAEIPAEAEPLATGNPSGLPEYRPR